MPYCTHNHTYQDSKFSHLYSNSNHLIFYTHTDIYHDSVFALNYLHFHSIHVYTHTTDAEIKNLVSFTPDIKLKSFTFMFFTLSGTHTQAYESSEVLQLPPHSLTLTVCNTLEGLKLITNMLIKVYVYQYWSILRWLNIQRNTFHTSFGIRG